MNGIICRAHISLLFIWWKWFPLSVRNPYRKYCSEKIGKTGCPATDRCHHVHQTNHNKWRVRECFRSLTRKVTEKKQLACPNALHNSMTWTEPLFTRSEFGLVRVLRVFINQRPQALYLFGECGARVKSINNRLSLGQWNKHKTISCGYFVFLVIYSFDSLDRVNSWTFINSYAYAVQLLAADRTKWTVSSTRYGCCSLVNEMKYYATNIYYEFYESWVNFEQHCALAINDRVGMSDDLIRFGPQLARRSNHLETTTSVMKCVKIRKNRPF